MRKIWLAMVLLGFGCGSRSLGGGDLSDSGTGEDARPADLGTADQGGCSSIATATADWLESHVDCQRDADCAVLFTSCGLPGMCGVPVNTGAGGTYLGSLIAAWQQAGCYDLPPCECPAPLPPGCNGGRCGPFDPRGPIGDRCQSGFDCRTGGCLDEATNPSFPGGYCTIGCGTGSASCPAGSSCRAVAGGEYCLEDCQPGANDCRSGYACCNGGPGPVSTTPVCAPSASIYCVGQ